jgi:hypothetical protein
MKPRDYKSELESLSNKVINILDVKAKSGLNKDHNKWDGFTNGNGTEVGKDIESLIKKAKRLLK